MTVQALTTRTVIALCCLLMMPLARGGDIVDAFRRDGREQWRTALSLSRQAVDYACLHREPLPLPKELPVLLKERGAVFISSQVCGTGAPRFCMGTLSPRESSLAAEIIANAFTAVCHDTRFPPLQPKELKHIRVIVSIIGENTPIADLSGLDPLRDGLAIRSPRQTGVVLPGETDKVETMVRWGRIRAGARPEERVEFLRLDAVRYIEAPHTKGATTHETPAR